MAFIRIDGHEVDALIEGFSAGDDSVESFVRGSSNNLVGQNFARKQSISFETKWLAPADAFALENWVRGDKATWTFDRVTPSTTRFTPYSADGKGILTNVTVCSTPAFGYHCGLIIPGAISYLSANLDDTQDWTLHFYHRPSAASFISYGVRKQNGTVSAWQDVASATTTRMVDVIKSSGLTFFLLNPKTNAGASATSQYDAVTVAPFAYTDAMLTSIATPPYSMLAEGPTKPPFVVVTGDCLLADTVQVNGAGETGAIYAKGFVRSSEVRPVVIDGTFRYNARKLVIELQER